MQASDFNSWPEFEGKHAFMSPSGAHWLNYDSQKIQTVYLNQLNKQRGTELHEYAEKCIKSGYRLEGDGCLAKFVNDALDYGMASEVLLMYSKWCFGTADGITFDDESKLLRIHDLKTGSGKPKKSQLIVYMALFCHEYGHNPMELTYIGRFYQFNGFVEYSIEPTAVKQAYLTLESLSRDLDNMEAMGLNRLEPIPEVPGWDDKPEVPVK